MDLLLGDVEETALIPLSNRASETKRKNPRIKDMKAVEIIETLGIDTANYDKLVTHECVVARTIMFDDAVKKVIQNNPNGVFVNLGCGLDNRFERMDNGEIIWFDMDLESSIAVRKKVYQETERHKMIIGDVTTTKWIDMIKEVSGDKSVTFVAEGLFMYFSKQQTKNILQNFTTSFPRGILLVEMMRSSMMDEEKHDTIKHTNAKFGWGTNSGKEFEELESRLHLVSEHSFSEQMKKSTLISKFIGVMSARINNRLAMFEW